MSSRTPSANLFHDMNMEHAPIHEEDDDEASELNLELLNASEANIKLELGQKRKFLVKSEPHCISDQDLDYNSCEPQSKRARTDCIGSTSLNPLPTNSNTHSNTTTITNNNTSSNPVITQSNISSPFLVPVPVVPGPLGQGQPPFSQTHYVPVVNTRHHTTTHPQFGYAHPLPMSSYVRPHQRPFYGPQRVNTTGTISGSGSGSVSGERSDRRTGTRRYRRARVQDYDVSSDESDEDSQSFDKSPFKTTYVSRDEERELKAANNALYSQFHVTRQSIYRQFKQKVEGIRHSNLLCPEKRKLNVKIAAIDAKVQEKKLFLSYLEMTRPQPSSWMVPSATIALNQFAGDLQLQSVVVGTKENGLNGIDPPPTAIAINDEKNGDRNNSKNQSVSNQNQQSVNPKVKSVARRVKKPKFSDYNVRVLRDWYETHTNNPYPSAAEKHLMCQLTGLTKYQVSRWFCNVRTRKPPPELSDNDEDVDVGSCSSHHPPHHQHHRHQRPRHKQSFKVDPMGIPRTMFGHDFYGRPTATPHYTTVPTVPVQSHRMQMTPMGLSPMNFHGMNGINGMNPISPIPNAMNTMNGMNAMNGMNPHFNFQQIMNQKRMMQGQKAMNSVTVNNCNTNIEENVNQEMCPPEIQIPSDHEVKDTNVDGMEQTEGLMPTISSGQREITTPTTLLPPPLIDENSNISKQT